MIPLIRTVIVSVSLAALAITSFYDPTPPPAGEDLIVVTPGIVQHFEAVARHVVVERVIDGDTIALRKKGEEQHAEQRSGWAEVVRQHVGQPPRDRYGRTLSSVFVRRPAGLMNVALRLVVDGHVRVYEQYPTSETEGALMLQDQARVAGRGLWGTCVPSS